MEITLSKVNLNRYYENESETDEVSIILSEAADFNREELVNNNPDCFEDVHELIRQKR